MQNSTHSQVTEGILVKVWTEYIRSQSFPKKQIYVFAYHITIENQTEHTVQLLRRHWFIIDGWGDKREVEGEGVVGMQPLLAPGEHHTYTSGCIIRTPIGEMSGYYTFLRHIDDSFLKVQIPAFVLTGDALLN